MHKHTLFVGKKYENIEKKLFKNKAFDQNGCHHELSREQNMHFGAGELCFGRTANHFVNILIF